MAAIKLTGQLHIGIITPTNNLYREYLRDNGLMHKDCFHIDGNNFSKIKFSKVLHGYCWDSVNLDYEKLGYHMQVLRPEPLVYRIKCRGCGQIKEKSFGYVQLEETRKDKLQEFGLFIVENLALPLSEACRCTIGNWKTIHDLISYSPFR